MYFYAALDQVGGAWVVHAQQPFCVHSWFQHLFVTGYKEIYFICSQRWSIVQQHCWNNLLSWQRVTESSYRAQISRLATLRPTGPSLSIEPLTHHLCYLGESSITLLNTSRNNRLFGRACWSWPGWKDLEVYGIAKSELMKMVFTTNVAPTLVMLGSHFGPTWTDWYQCMMNWSSTRFSYKWELRMGIYQFCSVVDRWIDGRVIL